MRTKEELRARGAAWRTANPDKTRAIQSKYRSKNSEKLHAASAAWLAANKEKRREYLIANADKIRLRQSKYRLLNNEKERARRAKYHANNPEISSRARCVRRSRMLNAVVGNLITIATWERSWRSKRFAICYWCSSRTAVKKSHMDHIQPLAKGGAHSIENLCIACSRCNLSKNSKSIVAWNATIKQPILL